MEGMNMTELAKQDQIELETLQETILEQISNSPIVQRMVDEEFDQRFPFGVAGIGVQDECMCMVQILVYERVMRGVLGRN
jgi:hypothetical protein